MYANNIDWNRPVGVVYYMDGDYWYNHQSKVHNPSGNQDLLAMARVANERNMLFVPVISPDKNAGGDGITWWENLDGNGDWFRGFATWFQSSHSLDRNNVWVIGYSGGAEMIGFELNADRQTTWRTGAASWSVEVTQTVCKLPQRKPLKPSPWTGTSVSGMKLASAGLLTGQH